MMYSSWRVRGERDAGGVSDVVHNLKGYRGRAIDVADLGGESTRRLAVQKCGPVTGGHRIHRNKFETGPPREV